MIQQVYAAPKQLPVEQGLAFARTRKLAYEIPEFVEPGVLDAAESHIARWQKHLSTLNGVYALHGPVYDINPVSLDPDIAAVSRKRYTQAVRVCKALGCRFLVVHSQYSPIFEAANVKKDWLNATVEFWQQFARDQLADCPQLTVVIENFMESDPALLRTLVEGIRHPQVKACLDTGHANLFSPVPITAWVNELEQQLVYIHSHNNHGKWDEHRGYPYGTMDMEAFLNHLVMLPYRVNLALEIFHPEELEESYRMVERYLDIQQEQLPEKTFLI